MIEELVLALAASSAVSTVVGAITSWLRRRSRHDSEVDVTITNSLGESVTIESRRMNDLSHEELVKLVETLQSKLEEKPAEQQ